jgi:hypothetical protein
VEPAPYRIRIRGHLNPVWSTWFDGLTVRQLGDGTTEFIGPLTDQAALFGLLARLRDLGATLLLVERVEPRVGDHNASAHLQRANTEVRALPPALPLGDRSGSSSSRKDQVAAVR